IFNIDNFQIFRQRSDTTQVENVLKKIASIIRDSVTEIDRVARIGEDEFAVVLPEKNKRYATQIAENIRSKIELTFSEELDVTKRITVSAGVSENPLDGVEAGDLMMKARESLNLAKMQGKNRVIG
ncbi:MAG: GGDEF domain-containing protein, partial [Candidatus Omnitrophica bacterium]|nr:GGDEF domain-containing protein [Candidatus Omnitrophota bacterium]